MDGFDQSLFTYSIEAQEDTASTTAAETISNAPLTEPAGVLPPFDFANVPVTGDLGDHVLSVEELNFLANQDSNELGSYLDYFIPEEMVQDINGYQRTFVSTTIPEADLHASFIGFFGDSDTLLLCGTKTNLQGVWTAIAKNGRAMERCDGADLALRLLLQYGVVACDPASCPHQHVEMSSTQVAARAVAGHFATSQKSRAGASKSQRGVVPARNVRTSQQQQTAPVPMAGNQQILPAPMPASMPTAISLPMPAQTVIGSPTTAPTPAPAVPQGPSQHALAGQPRPANIPAPLPKPRNTSHAAWDNAPLFAGLTNDEILSGYVHPEDIQGTLAIQIATNCQSGPFIDCVQALYVRLGLKPPQKSAITKRWTLALEAQCARDGKNFAAERARIKNARRNGRSTAADLLLITGAPPPPPLPPASAPVPTNVTAQAALAAGDHSDADLGDISESVDQDENAQGDTTELPPSKALRSPPHEGIERLPSCSCGHAFGKPHDPDCASLAPGLPVVKDGELEQIAIQSRPGKRKRGAGDGGKMDLSEALNEEIDGVANAKRRKKPAAKNEKKVNGWVI
ncbi:hypothetical protein CLAFUW4_02450 [Fulvia fulva]|uniref:Uncharacterized protein n=1 Tax=Passalora fulva TaxID=5499 RepID=A0A9Q8P614_PASFU|nr:uncharacterized protein CLAFUR5_02440 [Fulvia fulva]KAK4631203.1 hypothetical protein CLAFUR4_02445 [Fulvia fulva]KAK4632459.1 hypothetical protein CLAFUR0_02449 [Fulvia fulva]UJO14519.1 hypothetical protein CLAFUR5_02440 [Fulvia fulva]WPV10824.1 hypothetical protein CLAFUW4_02450 [Fulvia fulva]WPV25717.1 hypothetical protein CLAFUW7_02450 [Fulvia fulva]